jgi:hypothetical protein
LVVVGIGEDCDDFFEFGGGWGVERMVVMRLGPIEETEGFDWGRGTCAEDAEDEFRCDCDPEFVEGSFKIEVATNYVCNVLDCGEVFIFGGGG